MTRRRVIVAFAAVAGMLLVTTACAPQEPRLASLGDAYFAVVASESRSGMDAQIAGRIDIDGSGCFVIDADLTDRDAGITPVLWPEQTYLDHGIVIPGWDDAPEHGINEGTPIVAGGGEVTAERDEAPCWEKGDTYWQMAPGSAQYGFPE